MSWYPVKKYLSKNTLKFIALAEFIFRRSFFYDLNVKKLTRQKNDSQKIDTKKISDLKKKK